jgi:hypothetical protein
MRKFLLSEFLAVATSVVMLALLPHSLEAEEEILPAKTGTLIGCVLQEDQKTPVVGAVVRLRNMANQKEYASEPTKVTGYYRISGIEEGWYAVGVSAPSGDFNLDYGVNFRGNETARLEVWLMPGGKLIKIEEAKKKSFFKSPKGILGVAAATAGAAFTVSQLLKDKTEISPVRAERP